jgi:hypothetical protein
MSIRSIVQGHAKGRYQTSGRVSGQLAMLLHMCTSRSAAASLGITIALHRRHQLAVWCYGKNGQHHVDVADLQLHR